MASAKLKPGDQIPTQRELAAELGIAIGTVTRAYTEGRRRGLLSGEVGRGSFIAVPRSPSARETAAQNIIDLSAMRLVPEIADPIMAEGLRNLAARSDLSSILGHQAPAGSERHRETGANWIAQSGYEVGPDQIIVCHGAQHAMAVALGTLAAPDAVVLTEELNYPGIKLLERLFHVRLHGVALDGEGMLPDALDAACEATGARLLLCTPTIHNPTSAVMRSERRRQIAEIVVRRNLVLIENDPFAALAPEPILPISTLVPSQACYITSVSKTISTGVRVGFLALPPGLVERAVPISQAMLWMPSQLQSELLASWIDTGKADDLLNWHRSEARWRQNLAKELLTDVDFSCHPYGYHVWINLPSPWRAAQFTAQLANGGVLVSPAELFVVGRAASPHAVRACLGGVQDRATLRRGLELVARTLRSGPQAQRVFA